MNAKLQKIKPVDVILIVLLLIALLFGLLLWHHRQSADTALVPIEYTLCLFARPKLLAEQNGSWEALIPIGTPVSNANATAEMGKVISLEIRPHRIMSVREGRVVGVDDPGLCDLYVTIRAYASEKEGDGLRVQDIRVAAGMSGDYHIGAYSATNALTVLVRCEVEK